MVTFRSVPESWDVHSAALVTGSVLISLDYFKRFVAGLRGIVGGAGGRVRVSAGPGAPGGSFKNERAGH